MLDYGRKPRKLGGGAGMSGMRCWAQDGELDRGLDSSSRVTTVCMPMRRCGLELVEILFLLFGFFQWNRKPGHQLSFRMEQKGLEICWGMRRSQIITWKGEGIRRMCRVAGEHWEPIEVNYEMEVTLISVILCFSSVNAEPPECWCAVGRVLDLDKVVLFPK